MKARRSGEGFKTLERWLGENYLLFLRRDKADPLVVMDWATYVQFISTWSEPQKTSASG